MSGFAWIGAPPRLGARRARAGPVGGLRPAGAGDDDRTRQQSRRHRSLAGARTVLPLIAMEFAFRGGSSQDSAGKPGVAHMVTTLLADA